MKNKRVLIIFVTIIGLFFFTVVLRLMLGSTAIGEKVGVIDIIGIISQADPTIKLIHAYRDDPSVKAVVIRIDTPGGSVAPVQEIYSELKKIDKPLVASMGGTAASGGYYLACAADTIVANPGTLTGSIGVIMQFTRIEDLYNKVGLEQQVIKSGKFKDKGSPFREMNEEERIILQETVDDVHAQFVETIFQAREVHLTRGEVEELADGRIFSGKQALNLKLLDKLGNLPEAIEVAGQLANIQGTPKVVRKEKKVSLLEQLLGINAISKLDNIFGETSPTFRYQLNLRP